MVSDSDLIPDAKLWNNGRGIDLESWIAMNGNYDLAVGYSLLFWPEFVEIDDYVLRQGSTEANLREWEKRGGGRKAIEAVINHIHIADIHYGASVSEVQLRHLGRALQAIYQQKLAADYPERAFEVHFNDEPGLDSIDYELTFFQVPTVIE
ncbi:MULTISPECIES: hypothetical protein [unclassified Brevundimonas]|uniref:hypothetical protein n=1 Tax=unclassified Brevundimonas TaxID=2622653 RepID=UPI000CFC52F7|nr:MULTISPECIES: hypothetical protein [unclassified Brevundimonas]PRA36541.1 hypothetical protein CQ024_00055 [Brevundimonas sp. MYb27]PQZ78623.1 hypothetical protein CQ026_12085 [Brevundimonas sp. MYb31]PRB13599.1 hypothetical protein CQ039_12450 [Brevundimonas sp. MYb52]PRB34185.1 hypothetical protein CQ035_11035 [Brevundimonas sp. MYb46]PRB46579.1 hypothetical protein CQ028_11165 [Brevundimonas sp. MYb33]